jgi:hypothetical protein
MCHIFSHSWAYRAMQAHFLLFPLSDDFMPMQVIGSQSEDSRKLCDTKTESVAFNTEVDGGLIPIATSPSSEQT